MSVRLCPVAWQRFSTIFIISAFFLWQSELPLIGLCSSVTCTSVYMAVGTEGALGAIAPPFPQKKKFETQLSNKYNMPYLIMIYCKCDFVLLTQQE